MSRELVIERQKDRFILCQFACAKAAACSGRAVALVSQFAMRAHDSSAAGNACVQQRLHDPLLIAALRQADAKTLPVTTRPFGFNRKLQALYITEEFSVISGQCAPPRK